MQKIDFQELLEKFDTQATFSELLNTVVLEPDVQIYIIMTNLGKMAVLEIDAIISLNHLREIFVDQGINPIFIKTKNRLDFESSLPVKKSSIYKKPKGWEIIRDFATEECGSNNYYFVFLVRIGS